MEFQDSAPSERKHKFIARPIGKALGLEPPKMATPQIILPPAPEPELPRKELAEVDKTQVRKRQDIIAQETADRARARRGRRQTIFAGGLGTSSPIQTATKTLLGE